MFEGDDMMWSGMAGPKKILVVCTANRCRSQMAEGWLRRFASGQADEVSSAGTRPSVVHPLAIRVMAEAGVDITGQRSKHLDEFAGARFDVLVTVCDRARGACAAAPQVYASRVLHRAFDDPDLPGVEEDELLAVFRRVRDEIRAWAWDFVGREL